MKRIKEHDEQIGYFTFVQNNDDTDYLKLAYACGLSLKATQTINKFAIAVDNNTKQQLTDRESSFSCHCTVCYQADISFFLKVDKFKI